MERVFRVICALPGMKIFLFSRNLSQSLFESFLLIKISAPITMGIGYFSVSRTHFIHVIGKAWQWNKWRHITSNNDISIGFGKRNSTRYCCSLHFPQFLKLQSPTLMLTGVHTTYLLLGVWNVCRSSSGYIVHALVLFPRFQSFYLESLE